MTRRNYYRQNWAPDGVDPNVLEKKLGEWLEVKAKHAIDRLIHQPSTLTEDDMATLVTYLEMQRIRVPRQAKTSDALTRAAILRLAPPDAVAAIHSGELTLTIKDSVRFNFMQALNGKLDL